ncbi:MAG: protein jag [Acidobacteriota bacterium]
MKLENDKLTTEVQQFLGELLKRAGLDLRFWCEPEDEVINVQLHGQDAGMVLSDNARLLYAINHLLNRVFYRKLSDGYNFVVDCNEYRATRVMELQLLARKAAEKVQLSGIPFRLQAMPASERRVVHLALVEEPGVRTESEGAGLHRGVVILPDE